MYIYTTPIGNNISITESNTIHMKTLTIVADVFHEIRMRPHYKLDVSACLFSIFVATVACVDFTQKDYVPENVIAILLGVGPSLNLLLDTRYGQNVQAAVYYTLFNGKQTILLPSWLRLRFCSSSVLPRFNSDCSKTECRRQLGLSQFLSKTKVGSYINNRRNRRCLASDQDDLKESCESRNKTVDCDSEC